MIEEKLSDIIALWEKNNPDYTTEDIFKAGMQFNQYDIDDIINQVNGWQNSYVNDLVFALLKTGKMSYTDLTEQYTRYLELIRNEKSEMISELATMLMMYRKKIYLVSEIPEVEKLADNILRKTNMFSY